MVVISIKGYFLLDGPNDVLQGTDFWFQKLRKLLGENLDTSTVLKSVPAPACQKVTDTR